MGSEFDLRQAQFFRALTPEQLARVCSCMERKQLARQQVLFLEGEPADFLWVLSSGEVRLYKGSGRGTVTTLEVLGPGETFGAISALDQATYPVSAEAVSDAVVYRLAKSTLLRLIEEEPRLAIEILRIVSRRLRDAHEQVRVFAHDPAPARIARALLNAAHDGGASVTRRALAEASGTTVETAIRVLRRFEKDGLLRGSVGHIHLLDESGLRRIAEVAGRAAPHA